MLQGKELILSTKPYAVEKRNHSWLATFSTLFCMVISFGAAYSPLPWWVRLIASLVSSLLLVRMFIIYHDYLHNTILKGSSLAKVLFTLYGWYTLNPSSIWKRSHDHHHKHNSKLFTSNIGSFPIVTRKKFLSMSGGERLTYLFIRHPLTIAAGYIFAFAWGMCILSISRAPKKHWDSAIALIFHFSIGGAVLYFGGWLPFLFGFFIPAVVSSAMGSYLFYAQHNFPGATFEDAEGWSYIKAAMESSSYMTMNPVMHWFTGNIGYHHIHHANAKVPFYRLPEVYKSIPEFQNARKTSLNPIDIYQCLRLKVWDPEKGKMISRKEIYA